MFNLARNGRDALRKASRMCRGGRDDIREGNVVGSSDRGGVMHVDEPD